MRNKMIPVIAIWISIYKFLYISTYITLLYVFLDINIFIFFFTCQITKCYARSGADECRDRRWTLVAVRCQV